MARLLLALSSDVTATDVKRAFSTGSSSFALTSLGVDALLGKGVDAPPDKGIDIPPDKGVDTPPDKGVDAPPDKGVDIPRVKGSRTSPGEDSAGAIRVSSDVTATDAEAMRVFSTGSSSFARHSECLLSYRSSKENGLLSTQSK